jgi:prevent-host-death family protein
MNTVTALEAKTRLGELLDRVARGEEVVITRHDKPVARMVPEGGRNLSDIRLGVMGLREVQEAIKKRTKGKARLSDAQVRAAIEEGRKDRLGQQVFFPVLADPPKPVGSPPKSRKSRSAGRNSRDLTAGLLKFIAL